MNRLPADALRGRKAIAAYFGVHIATIDRWVVRGLPVRRIGGGIWGIPAELDSWVG